MKKQITKYAGIGLGILLSVSLTGCDAVSSLMNPDHGNSEETAAETEPSNTVINEKKENVQTTDSESEGREHLSETTEYKDWRANAGLKAQFFTENAFSSCRTYSDFMNVASELTVKYAEAAGEPEEFDQKDRSTWVMNPDDLWEVGEDLIQYYEGVKIKVESMEYTEVLEDYPSDNYAASDFDFLDENGKVNPVYLRTASEQEEKAGESVLLVKVSVTNLLEEERKITATWPLTRMQLKEDGKIYYAYDTTVFSDASSTDELYRFYSDGFAFYVNCPLIDNTERPKSLFYQITLGAGESTEIELAYLIDDDYADSLFLRFANGQDYTYVNPADYYVPIPLPDHTTES